MTFTPLPDPTPSDELTEKLRQLDQRGTWMWVLATVLLAALALTLSSLKLAPPPEAPPSPDIPDTRHLFVVGLSGLVVLFSLYMLLKRAQLLSLRRQLVQSLVREESLRSRLSGVSSLFEGITQLGIQSDSRTALQALAEHVRLSLLADRTSILLLDDDGEALRPTVSAGGEGDGPQTALSRTSDALETRVARENRAIVVARDETSTGAGGSKLCVPLALPDQVIGVLGLERSAAQPSFGDEDARIVTVFASHIAIAIHRMREHERSQETLRQKEDQLRQSHKMEALGRLAGGVAHDFNNILTVILTASSRLIRGLPAGDPLRANAEKISDAAERCAALTRQLLTFSRKQVIELNQVDLNHCVEGMEGLLRRLIGENVELVLELGRHPIPVLADQTQIEQVVLNLALNARDALPHGGRVTIATEEVVVTQETSADHGDVAPGGWVVLSVTDTGLGMDAETRARVFEPFFTTKGQGTGLGLATVYGAVQQGGGTITVDSKPGHGSVFRIYLPLADALPTPLAGAETQAEAATARPARREATILLAEDQDDVRELVREMLQAHGYHVIEASWAGEAVVLAEAHGGPIDLMITDVVMPGESGEHLAQWMAQARPTMPVLFMSGYTGDEISRQGIERLGAGFIQKPFTEEAMIGKIEEILERAERSPRTRSAA